jgi:hypothetical protein
MDRKSTHQLRNGLEKREGPNRKDPLERDRFLAKWRLLLRRQADSWVVRAVAELKAKGIFEFLMCENRSNGEWQARDLFQRVLREMWLYREEAQHGLVKDCYSEIANFLKVEEVRIHKKACLVHVQEVSTLLQDLRKKVQRARKTLDALRERRQKWTHGQWQRLWETVPRKNLVPRNIELDTRLQVEIGKMFADYLVLEGVSVETIARLIILVYRAGELCAMYEGEVRTIYTNRALDVRNIRDILRGRGIGKGRNL